MFDFETLMFIIAFAPIVLIVIFLEVVLRYFFSVPKEKGEK
jgi:TRAP-type C4-dicarboxylate transport system permease small subunit